MDGHLLNHSMFETLMDNLQEGVYFVDTERNIQYWNKGAERITGYSRAEVLGRCCASNILNHINQEGVQLCTGDCPLKLSIQDGQPRRSEVYLRHKEGHRLPVVVWTSPIWNEEGVIVGALESFTDMAVNLVAFERIAELEAQALMCPLTLVANRRYADRFLEEKFSEWERYQRSFGVAFVDVDHFKKVNDRFGHATGDVVLKMIAQTLKGALRSFDFVARWGGEEFLIVLPAQNLEELAKTADRLRILVLNTSRQTSNDRIQVTISVGAALVRDDDTVSTLISRADNCMYHSKDAGRNLVTVDDFEDR
ncbi:MAG: sensor domain-containing diguanylate cyclase [Candidatus Hydrogenedentes bacterium]|nr:sensor domain-containing diguanylate cyclase [Candidatus Hydrogenedentota bacterium]